MKKIISTIAVFCFLFSDAFGQEIEWQNTIGGGLSDILNSIQQTTDGGYILGGTSTSTNTGDKTEDNIGPLCCPEDCWIIKVDSIGNIEWQNTIGGNQNDYLSSIKQTSDGGYILGGYSISQASGDKTENCIGGDDYWVVKLDAFGNILWDNTIGGNDVDKLYCIEQTYDGGYILGDIQPQTFREIKQKIV